MQTMRIHRRGAVALATFALAGSVGCNVKDALLSPQQPQVISPADVQNATGADAIYTGALGQVRLVYDGGNNNLESLWPFAGLMTDEFKSGDTFLQRNDADQRVSQNSDGNVTAIYNAVQQTRGRARDAINALRAFEPDHTAQLAEMYLTLGFAEEQLGQDFCNGIPLGETVAGVPVVSVPLTNKDVFTTAIARFDTALSALGSGTDAQSLAVKNAVLIAKARAQVQLGQYAAAASTVAGVPTSYQYLITFSINTQDNEWWQMQPATRRYTVGDSVDAAGRILNAIPFAESQDPRVPLNTAVKAGTKAFDGTTPYVETTLWGRDDPIAMLSGLDARLIEAEAKLQAGDIPGMTAILNNLRASPPALGVYKPAAMAGLVAPATKDDAITLYFREKAFWQFGRGERLGDLRRLVRQYGRTQDKVFPTGKFFKNGDYGTAVNFPVPDAEKSNALFTGCIDRSA